MNLLIVLIGGSCLLLGLGCGKCLAGLITWRAPKARRRIVPNEDTKGNLVGGMVCTVIIVGLLAWAETWVSPFLPTASTVLFMCGSVYVTFDQLGIWQQAKWYYDRKWGKLKNMSGIR